MIKKCFAIVKYKSGRSNLEEFSLRGNLPFTLREMEDWVKELPEVVKVKCFEKPQIKKELI